MKVTGLETIVKKLRKTAWQWAKPSMEQIASDLGLVDRTTGSDKWIGFRSPDPGFPCPDPDYPGDFLEYPYGFSIHGQNVSQFQLCLGAVDMGDVFLNDSERYNQVCEQKHAEFKASFKKAVKKITSALGKPVFRGSPVDDVSRAAYPAGWSGELTAVWQLTNARLILVYGQEDKELPIVLDLFVCPPIDDMQ